eukprot:CAMPEP_0175529860 /NCGR_PEP_ID=MMETSP0096-20121207/21370_1 /TAXON_ID=311494 /ORGANISM="Alexandrium monilatum, Strain CCMP3105" /LENGTH=340 /DNA_ID=CAMNT_0016832577 /DNA_START=39 /DNA_END=1061 /DNA_ORIENTATION=+
MGPWRLALPCALLASAATGHPPPPSLRNGTAGGREGPLGVARGLQSAPVVVEVYYSPSCRHCLDFIRAAVVELVKAKLPGGLVHLTVLPLPFSVLPPDQCAQDPRCYGELAPLCAMRATQPHPTPIDSPALLPAVEFLVCSLTQSVATRHPPPGIVRDCAGQAGLPWQPIESCARGEDVQRIMFSSDYNNAAPAAVERLAARGFNQERPYSMPLVFINGELLSCGGGGCTATRTPSGKVPLQVPGSLLFLVCSKLAPRPQACPGGPAQAAPLQNRPTPACENCEEVGVFHWHYAPQQRAPLQWLCIAGLAAFLVAAACLVWKRRQRQQDPAWADLSQSME